MNDNSYTNWLSMSDKALIEAIGNFVKHNRLNQNRSQSNIAVSAAQHLAFWNGEKKYL